MKTKPIKAIAFTLMGALALAIVFTSSCKKEGPAGPAGADGADGTNGTNGTNGDAVSAADQAAYTAADGNIGGRLYDHLISESNITDTTIRNHPDFFRCKQCHGWDLRGSMGAYINRAPTATRPPVASNDLYVYGKTHNIRQIFDAVKHTGGRVRMGSATDRSYNASMPDYGLMLTDAQIWQIVKFLKNDAHNYSDFYDMSTSGIYPTGTKTFSNIGKGGSKTNGQTIYNSLCKGCHGADGKQIDVYCQGEFMGTFCRSNPHELQHKAKFGMPNDIDHPTCSYAGSMNVFSTITDQNIRDIMVLGQDTLIFPN
ncbi:MAG: c-type cytochrome [Bacteroidetes bacterium]|nr:c-type cytochrome [Bacteroidota bacterium]